MAQNMPVEFHKQGEVDNKDSDSVCTAETEDTTLSGSSVETDLLSFRSIQTFSVATPIEDLSDDLVSALLELPDGLMQLTTVASNNHNVSNEHLLRSSHSTSTNNPSSSETFNVLIDSGCSVSCT
eukprot:4130352-Ditylum_brightwellii.AAC.1